MRRSKILEQSRSYFTVKNTALHWLQLAPAIELWCKTAWWATIGGARKEDPR